LSSADSTENTGKACSRCRGAGFFHPHLADGRVDYSRAVACRCRSELTAEQKRKLLVEKSNLSSMERFTFDNLNPEGRSGYQVNRKMFKTAYEAALEFAGSPKGWMVVVGPSGSGKTHLVTAVAVEQLRQEREVLYITAPDLLEHLRSSFNPSSDTDHDTLFDEVRNISLLILDDMGIHATSSWAKEKLDQLLSYRFNRELPTLITMLDTEDLEERLRTRLNDTMVCHIYQLEMDRGDISGYEWGPGLELQKQMTFKNFDWKRANLPVAQRENLEKAYRTAMDYARSPDGWLVWQGVTGSGKTHLASAIVNYLHQAGKQAVFIVVPEFIDHLRSAFSPESSVSYDQLFEKVKTANFLVLDDFGEQTTTPWAQEKLYQVINYRYNARLATVITTTRLLDELDSRIRSRLLDPKISMTFSLQVPDYRSDPACRPVRKTAYRPASRR